MTALGCLLLHFATKLHFVPPFKSNQSRFQVKEHKCIHIYIFKQDKILLSCADNCHQFTLLDDIAYKVYTTIKQR